MTNYIYTRNEKIIRGVWLAYVLLGLILSLIEIFVLGLGMFWLAQIHENDWVLNAFSIGGAIANLGWIGIVYHCVYRKNGTALLGFQNFFGYIALGFFGYQLVTQWSTLNLITVILIALVQALNVAMRQVNKRVFEFKLLNSEAYLKAIEFFKKATNVDELKELFAPYMRDNDETMFTKHAINQAYERQKKQLTAQQLFQ